MSNKPLETFFQTNIKDKKKSKKSKNTLLPDNWLEEYKEKMKDKCWNCAKTYTKKNPNFWKAHISKILDKKIFPNSCTRCGVRLITDGYNINYYRKQLPKVVALALELKK